MGSFAAYSQMNGVPELGNGFNLPYLKLGGTTGYSANQGAWVKNQLQQDLQQKRLEKNTSEKKRRKWAHGPANTIASEHPGDGVHPMYQIAEGEEEEEGRIGMLSRENSRHRIRSFSKQGSIDGGLKLVKKEKSVPEIVVTVDNEENKTDMNNHGQREVTYNDWNPKTETLKLPTFKPNSKALFPSLVPNSFTYLPPDKDNPVNHASTSEVLAKSRYLQSPTYTHIRVPRRANFVTHVSQESLDSPLAFPQYPSPKVTRPHRKPITVSLTQSIKNFKRARKNWNFASANEPTNFFSSTQSTSSATTKNTEDSKPMETVSPNDAFDVKEPMSLEDLRKQTLLGLESSSSKESDKLNSNKSKDYRTKLPNVHESKTNSVVVDSGNISYRKKWVLPEHWPMQDIESDASKPSHPSKKPSAKTPRKSKRMGARLDGHSSAEVDSSRSVSESMESRPPVSHRKLEEKILRKSVVEKYLDKPSGPQPPAQQPVAMEMAAKQEPEPDLDDTLKAGNATVSSSVSVASSQDDTPMLQKLKAMNNKDQTSSRKKDIPRWLKQEDILTPFQSPAESRDVTTGLQGAPPRTPPTQEEINMLIDEELSQFPEKRKPGPSPVQTVENSEGSSTPMQRIEKNRSKWRENPGMNLEESWGSLTQFNKSQRGRLSLDMDDDVLDEYINKAAKLAGLPTEPAIQEEETPSTEPSAGIYINSEDEDFIIPELPYGRELVVNIRSTWGDKHYVGLTGIEVFSATGEQANIVKIRADPSDINILPEYDKDPRVVKNLIDGSNRTRDDIHMWLAPFTAGRDHLVLCSFEKPCKVALIRIWNYNKSRIHSYRGAKDVVMTLDSTVIFRGEIARACGGIEGGTEAFGDTILFTTDEGILELVSQNDAAYEGEMLSDDEPFDVERPSTADAGEEKGRPLTRAVGNIKQLERELTVQYEGNMMVYRGKCIELNFTATWGDMHYLGLTGLEVVGKEGEAIPINITMLTANPRDVRTLPGHEKDDRTLDKVIDGNNVTVSDEHMWLVPFVEGQSHTLTIDFGEKVLLAGLRIWNYNKSKEDTYRGARTVHVSIDGKVVSPPEGFLVRKGPGNCHFDFAQEISFSPQSWNTGLTLSALGSAGMVDESDNYEVVQMPCGFIYQLQLFSTWGDAYYVGLNGIELYDGNLQKIELTQNNISAFPDSVNILEKMQNDVRTPDKLIDGVNDTMEGGHMWLAPIIPNHLNRVYVIFDVPTTISMIKIWNYSKTPNRGAKDFALLVDDLLVYNGVLQAVTQGARGILPNCQGPQPYHTILFTNNKDVLRKEKHTVINNQTGEQDVQMTNDKKIMSHYNDPKKTQSGKPVDQNLRPTTSVIVSKKRR
ncbi:hypothetical protein DPMN_036945 [Dreissena polymorpha]|uniref:KATNIP domain-containing protein n=1 Tax=Dreissena polymorpha TaxID=45954 RepID=A0A9D4MCJ1_DREPO|nr:hypothetical protein DPMN_036945 [Dreissena polymorpha]